MNPFREINWRPDRTERRKFALSLVIGFPVVGLALLLAGGLRASVWNLTVPLTIAGGGGAVGLILWIVPQIARPFYLGWHLIAACLAFIIGNAVLAAVYVLIVVPIGLALRLVGRRALTKGFDRKASTYWHDAEPPDKPERYYREF